MAVFLSGCSTIMCSGTGTCHTDANGRYITDPNYYSGIPTSGSTASTASGFNRGGVIVTNSGNYVVVPSATGSLPSAIIRSGR